MASSGYTDMPRSTSDAALLRHKQLWNSKKVHEHLIKTHCSYCGSADKVPLKNCSHCK